VSGDLPIPTARWKASARFDAMRLAIYRNGHLILHREFSSPALRLGRLGSCDVVLEGDDVARFHAVIDRAVDGRSFELTDLSAGSTRVNGVQVARAKLHEGDEIRIGSYRIVVSEASPSEESVIVPRVSRVLWSATPEEMATEPATGEIAVRRELAKVKVE
jgi:predicted component of type VI protein secretion system